MYTPSIVTTPMIPMLLCQNRHVEMMLKHQ